MQERAKLFVQHARVRLESALKALGQLGAEQTENGRRQHSPAVYDRQRLPPGTSFGAVLAGRPACILAGALTLRLARRRIVLVWSRALSAQVPGTIALVALLCVGCPQKAAPAPAASASVGPARAAPAEPRAPKEAPLPNERVEIPGGSFFAGSIPGDPGRDPELESRRVRVELGPYQIDRLPYPNDPNAPPLTGVPRDEARRLCSERGARLCTELEWERACKGPNSEEFPSGATWDARCLATPARCASGFDVLALGVKLREWTASDVRDGTTRAAIRGSSSADLAEHRCAARRALSPTEKAPDLSFRCCSGAPNAAVVAEHRLGDTFKKTRITAERLQKLLGESPQTRELAKDVRFFKDPDSAETVVARGPGDRKGFSFTVAPLLWNPVAGAEFLLVAARSGEATSFVAAFHVLGEDAYRLASSFILRNEPGPIAFAYDDGLRPRLHFSSCWGCPGETGKILFRKPERAVILQP